MAEKSLPIEYRDVIIGNLGCADRLLSTFPVEEGLKRTAGTRAFRCTDAGGFQGDCLAFAAIRPQDCTGP